MKKSKCLETSAELKITKKLVNTHLESIDWATELQVNCNNADLSSELFLKKIEQLINFWTPLQRVSNKKKKLQNKPWVTKGLLKSIETKNRFYRKICWTKNPLKREELVNNKYILSLTRKIKAIHFNNFFQENKLNLFKIWEGIRKIINIVTKGSKEINCIQVGNKTINNPIKINNFNNPNNFNNHFTSIGEKTEDNLVISKFNYSKYLSNPNKCSFFIKPTNAEKVLCEITKLKNNKSIGPSSIPLNYYYFYAMDKMLILST